MPERRLKRQLSLVEVLMLGTAGTIGAEVFTLTGFVGGKAGPLGVVAVLLAGVVCVSIALNYAELSTTFPVTGGGVTYVREAYGAGLLSFLVGSFDCLSSVFYAALSAVGFGYSLQVFLPGAPVVLSAILTVGVFTALNIMSITKIGRIQVIFGLTLLGILVAYIVLGLTRPGGFDWAVYAPQGRVFESPWVSVAIMFSTMALIFNSYVGFEMIASDTEEVKNPSRTMPIALLVSLGLITVIYTLVTLVTLGTVPREELTGSATALAQAARRFWPVVGVPMIGVAGIIATLTSVNVAMLAATREALTLSRDGLWPRYMSRLGTLRTPYAASLTIGAMVGLVSLIGLVDFLAYISSSGYLFMVFWVSLAMIRLRRKRPDLERPFKVPWYPFTPYAAVLTCVLILAFTDWRPLLFGGGVLLSLTCAYLLRQPAGRLMAAHLRRPMARNRLLVPVANPRTAQGLARLTSLLARNDSDLTVCLLSVLPTRRMVVSAAAQRLLGQASRSRLQQVVDDLRSRNIPVYTKRVVSRSVAEGILAEVRHFRRDRLILMGWPGPLTPDRAGYNLVTRVLHEAHAPVAVFLDRNLGPIRRILVPIGGGPHSRLAVRLAYELAQASGAEVTALRCRCGEPSHDGDDDLYDDLMLLREIIAAELGGVPKRVGVKAVCAPSIMRGIQEEIAERPYDLVVMGAAVLFDPQTELFGSVADRIAADVPTSVLLVRRYEAAGIGWIRRQVKQMEGQGARVEGAAEQKEASILSPSAAPPAPGAR
jgi:amino acid transporter/nucleotide-binding universal stress UspA family protein